MSLSIEEKNKMLEMLGAPVQGQAQAGIRPQVVGVVRITDLVNYRTKTDEEIRAELFLYDLRKKEALQTRLAQIEASKAKLSAELALLNGE
jgi:hypothetical protein